MAAPLAPNSALRRRLRRELGIAGGERGEAEPLPAHAAKTSCPHHAGTSAPAGRGPGAGRVRGRWGWRSSGWGDRRKRAAGRPQHLPCVFTRSNFAPPVPSSFQGERRHLLNFHSQPRWKAGGGSAEQGALRGTAAPKQPAPKCGAGGEGERLGDAGLAGSVLAARGTRLRAGSTSASQGSTRLPVGNPPPSSRGGSKRSRI